MNQEKKLKCVKYHQNAQTEINLSEFTHTYPIRDKNGQIYCWYFYKSISHCKGCGKSVANLKFPRRGNPSYPHVSGYSKNCERVENKVEFICSQGCVENLAKQKYQAWKDKLNQGWSKCEECWKTWSKWEAGGMSEWIKEEKNQWKLIKLAQPGQGKLCSEHKEWEEKGKPEYESKNVEYQKRWETLSQEEKLAEVKKEYRRGENITEMAARSAIPPLVLHKWREKDSHRQHNCPDCQLDNEARVNNLSATSAAKPSDNGITNQRLTQILHIIQNLEHRIAKLEKNGDNSPQIQALKQEVKVWEKEKQEQLNSFISIKNQPANHQATEFTQPNKGIYLLIVGGLLIVGVALLIGYLLRKDKNKQ